MNRHKTASLLMAGEGRLQAVRFFSTEAGKIVLLLAIVVAMYAPSLWFPYVHDDFVLILGEGHVALGRDPAAENDGLINQYWRPLMDVINQWVFRIGGGRPWIFHGFNLIVHGLNIFLVYRWWRVWLSLQGAFWAALIFAVHPLQVESVAAIAGLSNLMMFCLGWTGCRLVHKILTDQVHFNRLWYHIAAGGSFLAALLVKEQALVWPAALIVQCLLCPDLRQGVRKRPWDALKALLIWAGVVVLWGGLHPGIGGMVLTSHGETGSGVETVLRSAMWPVVTGMYWRLFIWPLDVHYFRSFDIVSLPWFELTGWVFPLIVIWIGVRQAGRRQSCPFWILSFGVVWWTLWTGAVCLTPLFLEGTRFALFDHFAYPALAGGAPLAVVCVSFLMALSKKAKFFVVGLVVVWVVSFTTVLFSWKGDVSLFERALRYEPHVARVWQNLAVAYTRVRRLPEAGWAYQEAGRRYLELMHKAHSSQVRLWYRHQAATMHVLAAQILLAEGQPAMAMALLKQAVSFKKDPRFYNWLGIAAAQEGEWEQAVASFKAASEKEPLSEYTVNWAAALAASGRLDEAREILEDLVRQRPDLNSAQTNLMKVYEQINNTDSKTTATGESDLKRFEERQ